MKVFSIILISLSTLFFSCKKYETNDRHISNVEGPVVGEKGQKIPFTFSVVIGGSCSSIGDINDSKKGNEITIEVEVNTYPGGCTTDLRTEIDTYEFCERKAGTYLLKFKSYDGFIEKTITIK